LILEKEKGERARAGTLLTPAKEWHPPRVNAFVDYTILNNGPSIPNKNIVMGGSSKSRRKMNSGKCTIAGAIDWWTPPSTQ
jgi:hypothetical protein